MGNDIKMTIYDIAEDFVENTSCSIFLTGKAGTGKTTFLKKVKEQTHKQMVVVAPTGVAAINAGGSTIHSFFQIPPSPYIPTHNNAFSFFAKHQVNSARRKLFRQLELLIIDEISMVRADLLDLIDVILRHYRYRPNEPFGGVQLIFIGDIYQLAPVCTNEEWTILKEYYESPYFFHSKVLEKNQPIYIELDKIFRQTNQLFIDILNEVRNNKLTEHNIGILMRRYIPDFKPNDNDGYITLTTHNANADTINTNALAELDSPDYYSDAIIDGDFPEKMYPNDRTLHLKKGAKVMFLTNDTCTPRRFYNGKIGVVSEINNEEIFVTCDGETEPIQVVKEKWKNVQYRVNKDTNAIEEVELGTFLQIPLRLAWAITIHKSQGLTFDKVIIDAGAAFASGQVYVALSRCRSLDGIVLTTPININSLYVNSNIVKYSSTSRLPINELESIVESMKKQYSIQILVNTFSLDDIRASITEFTSMFLRLKSDFNEQTEQYLNSIQKFNDELHSVAKRFVQQLIRLANDQTDKLSERIAAASDYYSEQLTELITFFEASPVVTDSKAEADEYKDRLQSLYDMINQRVWIISNIRNDYSVNNYFTVKNNYRVSIINIKAYSGDNTVKQLIKTKHPILYQRLVACRNDICETYSLPVYMVANTKMLVEIADKLPSSGNDLESIKGFGKAKIKRFGQKFIDVVVEYCFEYGITGVQNTISFSDKEIVSEEKKSKKGKETHKQVKVNTIDESLRLLKSGYSIEKVAKIRSLTRQTIELHLMKLIVNGELNGRDFIEHDKFCSIQRTLIENTTCKLSEIFDILEEKYSYHEIKIVRAQMIAEGII